MEQTNTEDAAADLKKPSAFDVLTPTQHMVAKCIALGMSCREIADQRGCSVKTVDTHRGAVLKALDVKNNVGLARLAIREGEVDAP